MTPEEAEWQNVIFYGIPEDRADELIKTCRSFGMNPVDFAKSFIYKGDFREQLKRLTTRPIDMTQE